MDRSRRQLPAFRRRSAMEASVPLSEIPRTLEAGVLHSFPDANPRRFAAWLKAAGEQPGVECEFVLFVALLVGVRLRVTREDLSQVLEQLWAWFTSMPKKLKPEVADLVIEALAPALAAAVEGRGWQFGATGSRIRRQGRPPESRAVWTTALLASDYFRQAGVAGAQARELATLLAAVLSGRAEAGVSELYRARGLPHRPSPRRLLKAIEERYEHWLELEGMQQRDAATEKVTAADMAAWRERHRALTQMLGMYGAERFARLVLGQMPDDLWQPFVAVRDRRKASRCGSHVIRPSH
jgi:hypothetical protein